MTAFSWLHFSDLHWGSRDHDHLWGQVQRPLLEDIDRLQKDYNLKWDVVFFTGDLVNKGEKEEFDGLDKRLKRFWNHFRKSDPTPKLVVVPGNHDLKRPDEIDPALRTLTNQWGDKKIQDNLWDKREDSPYWNMINNAFENYQNWWQGSKDKFNRLDVTSGYMPGDFCATHEKDGRKIGIVGFNTAFLQLKEDNYKERLEFNPAQFEKLFGTDYHDWFDDHDICFLLTHHPETWLSDNAKQTFNDFGPANFFQLHLSGHLHDNQMQHTVFGDNTAFTRMIQSSSLFGCEKHVVVGKDGEKKEEKKNRVHGFCAGTIEFGEKKHDLTVWPRSAKARGNNGYEFRRHLAVLDKGEDCIKASLPVKRTETAGPREDKFGKKRNKEKKDRGNKRKTSIKKNIRDILVQKNLKSFHEFLLKIMDKEIREGYKNGEIEDIIKKNKSGGDVSEELSDILVNGDLLDAISPIMDYAVKDYFKKIRHDGGSFNQIKDLWDDFLEIIGWIVMLSIHPNWVDRKKNGSKINGLEFITETDAGLEILFSELKESHARFEYDEKNVNVCGTGQVRVSFHKHPECYDPSGWHIADKVLFIEKEIYRAIHKIEPPGSFSGKQIKELNATIKRRNRNKEYNYLCVPTDKGENPLSDMNVYKLLCGKDHLPELNFIVHISMENGEGALIVPETELKACLVAFFRNRPKEENE